jgi:hypothetical protein
MRAGRRRRTGRAKDCVAGGDSEVGNDEVFDPDSLTYIQTILTTLCFSLS